MVVQIRYTLNYNIPLEEGIALKKAETKTVVYNNKSSSQILDYDLVGGLPTDLNKIKHYLIIRTNYEQSNHCRQ